MRKSHKESCVILDQYFVSDLRLPILFAIKLLKETEENNEITMWFGLEGTLKIIQFQPPIMGRNTFY